jgi:hypothetical protein
MSLLTELKKDLLRIIFSKGFIRRRKIWLALTVMPIGYYSIFYEWDVY